MPGAAWGLSRGRRQKKPFPDGSGPGWAGAPFASLLLASTRLGPRLSRPRLLLFSPLTAPAWEGGISQVCAAELCRVLVTGGDVLGALRASCSMARVLAALLESATLRSQGVVFTGLVGRSRTLGIEFG